MRRVFLIAVLAVSLLPTATLAGTLGMTVDSKDLEVGQTTQVHITVRGGSAGRPVISAPAGLELVQLGVDKDKGVERGRLTITHAYTYTLTATQPGTYTFGPARCDIDGQNKTSATHTITVTEGTGRRSSGRTRNPTRRSSRGEGATGAPAAGQRGGDYYAIATTSDDRPYVGESITYDVEIGSFLRTLGKTSWEQPTFSPLSSEPGVDPAQEERQEILDGRRYRVNTIRLPLFAIEDGTVEIDPAKFTMTVMRRGSGAINVGQEVSFEANGLRVRVRPLPREGRPTGFGGAVGRFGVEASLDQSNLVTGGTATLTVRVVGAGSLRGQELNIRLPDSVKVYDEQPDTRGIITGDGLKTEVIYRKTLVPLQPGTFEIERIELPFFDPDEGAYRTARSQALKLTVTGEPVVDAAVVARSAELTSAKEAVEVLGTDILPLHTGGRMLGDARLRLTSPLVLGLLLLPLLGFGGIAAKAGGQRFAGTEGGRKRARGKAGKEARTAARRAAKDDDGGAAEEALRDYLSARLKRSGAALSATDGPDVVRAAGAPDDLADHLGRILERGEAIRYGGASARGFASTIADWIDDADRSWK
ncbi:MAG: protein BatD [Proteobacteria bacterium]|nr:protein BatD [Pseudomonadota bacterium]